jgi:hypothetical protein
MKLQTQQSRPVVTSLKQLDTGDRIKLKSMEPPALPRSAMRASNAGEFQNNQLLLVFPFDQQRKV